MTAKTKKELNREIDILRGILSSKYEVTKIPYKASPSHIHAFEEWELVSDGGIAFCDWKCSCGLEVSQCIGERLRPQKVPESLERGQTWREEA